MAKRSAVAVPASTQAYRAHLAKAWPSRSRFVSTIAAAALPGLLLVDVLLLHLGMSHKFPAPSLYETALVRLSPAVISLVALALASVAGRARWFPPVMFSFAWMFSWANDATYYFNGLDGSQWHAVQIILNVITAPAVLPLTRSRRLLFYLGVLGGHAVLDALLAPAIPLVPRLASWLTLSLGAAALAWSMETVALASRKQFFAKYEMSAALAALEASRRSVGKVAISLSDSILQLGAATESLSGKAAQALDEAARVSGAGETVAQAARGLADRSRAGATRVQTAQQNAQSIEQTVAGLSEGIQQLVGAVTRSEESVTALEQLSGQIRNFVQTIRDIAAQTQLLALNANIEATRAGQYGRGIAVVAQEVRRLAGHAERSSAEVKGVVENVETRMRGALQAVISMREQTERFSEGFERVETALDSIRAVVADLQQSMMKSAGDADEQASATQQIAVSIAHLSRLSDSTADLSQGVAETANRLAGDAESLRLLLPEASEGAK